MENKSHQRRQQELGFFDLDDVESFAYPTFFTARFDHFATGEGRTIGIVLGYVRSATELKSMIEDYCHPYYAMGAEIWPQLQIPPGAAELVPDAIKAIIAEPSRVIGSFYFRSTYHLNRS